MESTEHKFTKAASAPALYLLGFVAVLGLVIPLLLWVAGTTWFLQHDNYPGFGYAGYATRLVHEDCDVVLYGDSTTLTGLDPGIVQKITGLKSCNLSEGVLLQQAVGSDFPLDTYLQHNKRPRFLLAMYSPLAYRPISPRFAWYSPEGVLYGLQFVRKPWFYLGVLKRPKWFLQFVAWVGSALTDDLLTRLHILPAKAQFDARTQREQQHGVWRYQAPPETHCTEDAYRMNPNVIFRYADVVAAFRQHYSVEGTTVLVNIAPVPNCERLQDVMRRQSEGLHDNAFETLPVSYFYDSDIHPTAEGARHISIEAGYQILQLKQQQDRQQAGPLGASAR